jgi:hypothetical protein
VGLTARSPLDGFAAPFGIAGDAEEAAPAGGCLGRIVGAARWPVDGFVAPGDGTPRAGGSARPAVDDARSRVDGSARPGDASRCPDDGFTDPGGVVPPRTGSVRLPAASAVGGLLPVVPAFATCAGVSFRGAG